MITQPGFWMSLSVVAAAAFVVILGAAVLRGRRMPKAAVLMAIICAGANAIGFAVDIVINRQATASNFIGLAAILAILALGIFLYRRHSAGPDGGNGGGGGGSKDPDGPHVPPRPESVSPR